MKRTNVVLDEELLEKARRVSGEKTYSATINKLLANAVRLADQRAAIAEIAERNKGGAMLNRAYVEEMWPESAALIWPRKRASADEVRAPKKKAKRRASR